MLKCKSTSSLVSGVNMRGDGYFVRGGVIYTDVEVDGKRYRRSTGLSVCKKNISYVEKNAKKIILDMLRNETPKDFVAFALEVIKSGQNRREIETQKGIEAKFRKEIKPFFSKFEFHEIKPILIENWINVLYNKYSINTVKKYVNILHNIMLKAVANDLCEKDPFVGVTPIKREPKKTRAIYSEDEMFEILKNAKGWFRTFITLAFGTGARTGEILALQWSDIDFENKTITISKSQTKGRTKTTKTNNVRVIDMLDIVYRELKSYSKCKEHEVFLFVNKDKQQFYEPKNVIKYHFKPLLEELRIEYKTLYVSRHSFISLMLNKNMDLLWVQHTVGHASSTTTLRHYAQYQNGDKSRLEKANFILNNGTLVAQSVGF